MRPKRVRVQEEASQTVVPRIDPERGLCPHRGNMNHISDKGHLWEGLLWFGRATLGVPECRRVTFHLDLCPTWTGVPRDIWGPRGIYDLHLYTLRPLCCFRVLSCHLRQLVCSGFLFSCQLWMTPDGEAWAIPWTIWLRLTLSLPISPEAI